MKDAFTDDSLPCPTIPSSTVANLNFLHITFLLLSGKGCFPPSAIHFCQQLED